MAGIALLHRSYGVTYAPLRPFELGQGRTDAISRFLRDPESYYSFSPTLGWTIRSGKPHQRSQDEHANSAGLRGVREYQPAAESGVLRIAAFGDSFTYGSEVPDVAAWPARLEAMHPTLEVLNFGIPGYGLDQAYLRYQEQGIAFHPRIVLIGFMAEDIERAVNTFRPFLNPREINLPLAKPRFVLSGVTLSLIPNPISSLDQYQQLLQYPESLLPVLGSHDAYYQASYSRSLFSFSATYRLCQMLFSRFSGNAGVRNEVYDSSSQAYKITEGLFDAFTSTVRSQGSQPVVILFPDRVHLSSYQRTGKKIYQPLLDFFAEKGVSVIDAFDIFAVRPDTDLDPLFTGVHYSPAANRKIAESVWEYLRKHQLVPLVTAGS